MKKQYQLSEFQFYDGEEFITFNLIDINTEKKEITVAVTDRGRISVHTSLLRTSKNSNAIRIVPYSNEFATMS